MNSSRLLVTGASGMVGSAVARRAVAQGYKVRCLVRPGSDRTLVRGVDAEVVEGDLRDFETAPRLLKGADLVVHAAAHIGDWGPAELYRLINVFALEHLVAAARHGGRLQRWVQVSSLGVYPARDHFGTDESVPVDPKGLDGYTRTKAEAEIILQRHIRDGFPAVILRPGFIYGPGERHVIPRLLRRFEAGSVRFIGDGKKYLNNVHLDNVVDAIFLALHNKQAIGETFNIRDKRLVTREEYLMSVADYLGKPRPGSVPLWLARAVCPVIEGLARLRRQTQPPVLTAATLKFMALNLDFSIAKAQRVLGYQPQVDFQQGMKAALDWATAQHDKAPMNAHDLEGH